MSTTVAVAPREIHDLAYRASRIAGCDPGSAERIAENVTFAEIHHGAENVTLAEIHHGAGNVTFAEIHHGAAVRAFCEALEVLDLPLSAWVAASDVLLATEVAARTGGVASARFDPGVPMAAIAGTLRQSLERGVAAVGIDGRVRGDTTVEVVEMHRVNDEAVAASRARLADARNRAHRLGVGVDRIWFSRLEAAAAGFLVAETALDEVC